MVTECIRTKIPNEFHINTGSASVSDNYVLQYDRPGPSGECELIIGLDFGTSSSKVVIQAPDLPGRPSYAVDFGQFSYKPMPYLLPTRLWVMSDGACSLGPRDGAKLVTDIKLELFSKNECLASNRGPTRHQLFPEETAACYLALLLRFSRRWFLETKKDLVRHFRKLIWNVNLGVPSPCIENNKENLIFQRVGKAAWKLSTLTEELITLRRARNELNLVEDPEYWETDEDFSCDFEIIPEVAAGAVGYALSDHRREGLHVMVDIGASTVDVCSFKLHAEEGSDHYSLLIADVQQLGTIRLFNDRLVALNSVYRKRANYLRNRYDPLIPLGEDLDPFLVPRDEFIAAVEEAKDNLKEQFLLMLRRVIWQTRLRRHPEAPVWKKGWLPILLIGGGSRVNFFRSAVEELDVWLKHHCKNDGTNILSVPMPASLTNPTEKDGSLYLAVPWGLSHRALDIGEIIPADRIPDAEPPKPLNLRNRFMIKSKYNSLTPYI